MRIRRESVPAAVFLLAAAAPAFADHAYVYPTSGRLSQVYWTPVTYTVSGYHKGLDIVGPSGQPVAAARAGTVGFAGWSTVGYGNLVILNHESGYQTYYAHNSSFSVRSGDVVTTNQTIALEGTTGNSTGPHCHWEIRRYGTPLYLPGRVGETVVRGAPLPYAYADLAPLEGPPPPAPLKAYRIAASSLNVRSGPGTAYPILGTAALGQTYASTEQSGGWARIWFAGNTGWCSGAYLTEVHGVAAQKVTPATLNVRSGPGTAYAIVGTARSGEIYCTRGSSGGWWAIDFGGSSQRWFSGGYTTPVTIP
jgi:murein DD-endopeptidase MepM/ murein hydrolase activator NlpD